MTDTGPPPTAKAMDIFTPLLSPRLSSHLSHLPASTPLHSLSRIPLSRLKATALPHISIIELVTAQDFANLYDKLYISMFPKQTERERSDLIVARLAAEERGERKGLAPYRIVGIRGLDGSVVGAAQFSVLPIPPRQSRSPKSGRVEEERSLAHSRTPGINPTNPPSTVPQGRYAIPYLQYIYVHPSHRRRDISEVLHTFVLAIANADATIMDEEDSPPPAPSLPPERPTPRTVPFTLFETEPPDHGDSPDTRAYALQRSRIHTSSGGVALVLRRIKPSSTDQQDGAVLSAHVQPGLEPADPPLTLVWMIRPSPDTSGTSYDLAALGPGLMAAYYQSLRDEGFPESNIRLAERIVERRVEGSTFEIMPLADVRDFKMEEWKGVLDVENEHEHG